jgi:hypothetical protein
MTPQQIQELVAKLRIIMKATAPLVYHDVYESMSDERFLVDVLDTIRATNRYVGRPIRLSRTFDDGDLEELGKVIVQNQEQN